MHPPHAALAVSALLMVVAGCADEDALDDDASQDDDAGDDDSALADDDSAGPTVPVTGISSELHDIRTIVRVSWTQQVDADLAWLEFTFEDDAWSGSPPGPRPAGPHDEVILGVPQPPT